MIGEMSGEITTTGSLPARASEGSCRARSRAASPASSAGACWLALASSGLAQVEAENQLRDADPKVREKAVRQLGDAGNSRLCAGSSAAGPGFG